MKKQLLKNLAVILLVVFIAGSFTSCNSSKKDKKSTKTGLSKEEIKADVKEFVYPLPSSFEVTNMLNEIEAGYILDITNPAEKASSYLTEKKKALNLGVYAANLSYATTYNQRVESQKFVKSAELLVKSLDLTSAFESNMQEKLEKNIDNKEKLVELVTDIFHKSYAYLNKQGNSELSYQILAGAWIEGLYLTTHVSENYFQNPKIIKAILFQREPMIKLQKLMEPFKENELSSETYADLATLNDILKMEDNSSISEAQLKLLSEKLDMIRAKIVE